MSTRSAVRGWVYDRAITGLTTGWYCAVLERLHVPAVVIDPAGVPALDVPTIGGVVALLFTLAMIVTVRPALRAAQVDLARLLRE